MLKRVVTANIMTVQAASIDLETGNCENVKPLPMSLRSGLLESSYPTPLRA